MQIPPRQLRSIIAYKITEQSYHDANSEFKKGMMSYFKKYDQIRKSFYKSYTSDQYETKTKN